MVSEQLGRVGKVVAGRRVLHFPMRMKKAGVRCILHLHPGCRFQFCAALAKPAGLFRPKSAGRCQFLHTAQIRLQRGGDIDAAIGILVVFQHRH